MEIEKSGFKTRDEKRITVQPKIRQREAKMVFFEHRSAEKRHLQTSS
jgi:hypothetical protein